MEAFFGDLIGRPYYPDIEPEIPPANEPVQVGERWWGCKVWLIRGERPAAVSDPRTVSPEAVPHVLAAEEGGAKAKEARLSPAARWGRSNEETIAYVQIGAAPGFALNPLYLTYVGAAARVEDWRWLRHEQLLQQRKTLTNAGLVVGLRNRVAVAIVCPCVWEPA